MAKERVFMVSVTNKGNDIMDAYVVKAPSASRAEEAVAKRCIVAVQLSIEDFYQAVKNGAEMIDISTPHSSEVIALRR